MSSAAIATEIVQLAASSLAPKSANEAELTLNARLISGTPVKRFSYLEGEFELLMDPAGCDTSRVDAGTCGLVDSHQTWSIGSQLGTVTEVHRQADGLHATLKFFPSAEQHYRDSAAAKRGVSIGAILLEWKDEADANGKLIRRTVTKWQLYEVSLVAVPADPAAVTLSLETNMTQQQTNAAAGNAAAVTTQLELQRISMIDGRLKASGLTGDIAVNLRKDLVESGATSEQVSDKIFNALYLEHAKQPDTRSGLAVLAGEDETDKWREGVVSGLVARMQAKPATNGAAQWANMRLSDVARECLSRSGQGAWFKGERLSDARTVELAMTRSDFPLLLASSGERVLIDAYKAAEPAILQIARRTTVNDYREKTTIQLSQYPELLKVNESGEVKRGALGEKKEAYSVADFARIIALSRQAIVNDDLSAFSDSGAKFGVAAANKKGQLIVDLLTSNSGAGPTMNDGTAMFHGNHKNLGTAGALGINPLSEARKLMRLQVDIDGKSLISVKPRFLVVPAALETTAEKLLAEISAAVIDNVNPFSNKLELIIEPRLDAKSATRYYLFGEPSVAPVLEYAYLTGSEGLEIATREGFDTLGIEIRAVLTFGCGAIDWRGAVMNAGA